MASGQFRRECFEGSPLLWRVSGLHPFFLADIPHAGTQRVVFSLLSGAGCLGCFHFPAVMSPASPSGHTTSVRACFHFHGYILGMEWLGQIVTLLPLLRNCQTALNGAEAPFYIPTIIRALISAHVHPHLLLYLHHRLTDCLIGGGTRV